jgi:VWFA-related protein
VIRGPALALAYLLAVASASLQGMAQQPSFRATALGVRVDVLVTDRQKPVAGLTAQDFEVRDNGVVQTVDVVDAADIPLNVVLALDTSGSTAGARRADLIAASEALIDGLVPADRAALTGFSHAVVPLIALTDDLTAVRAALLRMDASGRTAVMDGVYVALTSTLAQPGRSLVVVCTDGADISSWLRPDAVVESARRSNAVIYAVTSSDARQVEALESLADATGGGVLRVSAGADLRGAFRRILQEFRSRYVLAYAPSGVPLGGFHRLDVRVKRRGLTVKARPGYIGAEPQK